MPNVQVRVEKMDVQGKKIDDQSVIDPADPKGGAVRGDIEGNRKKAEGYCREVVDRGYIPIAPHVYFTRFLNEEVEEERAKGMELGLELMKFCDELWIFGGVITEGMQREIDRWCNIRGRHSIKVI